MKLMQIDNSGIGEVPYRTVHSDGHKVPIARATSPPSNHEDPIVHVKTVEWIRIQASAISN